MAPEDLDAGVQADLRESPGAVTPATDRLESLGTLARLLLARYLAAGGSGAAGIGYWREVADDLLAPAFRAASLGHSVRWVPPDRSGESRTPLNEAAWICVSCGLEAAYEGAGILVPAAVARCTRFTEG